MEIIKDLPKVFNEFGEARRNSFIAVKEIKDAGTPVVGAYCTYAPQELVMAAGAVPIALCSMSNETTADAEQDLPANLCPLIKSSYGFAKTDKCPYFHFSDIVVGETTCDGKKKMYELMSDFKKVFVMNLPNSQDEEGRKLWRSEVRRYKEYLEKELGVEITDDQIREAVRVKNAERNAQKAVSQVMANDPAPIMGGDMFKVIFGSQYKFDKEESIKSLNAVRDKIMADYGEGKNVGKKPRILITGCPMGGGTTKIIDAVENNGGVVVAFENCSGYKMFNENIDENAADIVDAVADRYLNIGCSVMTPNPNRYELLGKLIDQYHVDGVLDMTLTACHTYNIEGKKIEKFCREEKGVPYIAVETDYSTADVGQLNTRISAFVEML